LARGAPGFIKWWLKEFDNSNEVLSPQYGIHVDRIESVQKNIVLFALRRLHWDAKLILPTYSSRLLLINLPALANRRTMVKLIAPTWLASLIFLFHAA